MSDAAGALYGTYLDPSGLPLTATVGGGRHNFDTQRSILGTGASGDLGAWEINSAFAASYDLHFGKFPVGPIARLEYHHLNFDSRREAGSPVRFD
jgi:uncharacterized protein YhjY with autotransporter beta-barrel domain